MAHDLEKAISAQQAAATANEWLVSYAGDRFLAGSPELDKKSDLWLIPILYVYPKEGPLGNVGEITVNPVTGELSSHPPVEEIKSRALDLYRANCREEHLVL